jgi:hypothetical protein
MGTADNQVVRYTQRDTMIYGRIMNEYEIRSVVGTEHSTEVLSGASLEIEEIV